MVLKWGMGMYHWMWSLDFYNHMSIFSLPLLSSLSPVFLLLLHLQFPCKFYLNQLGAWDGISVLSLGIILLFQSIKSKRKFNMNIRKNCPVTSGSAVQRCYDSRWARVHKEYLMLFYHFLHLHCYSYLRQTLQYLSQIQSETPQHNSWQLSI